MTDNAQRGLYFEDLVEGQSFTSAAHLVTAEQIREFSLLMGETNPLHLDANFAATTKFGTIIASGSFGLTLAISLSEESDWFHGTAVAALGIEQWHYRKPIVAGLTCRSRMTITSLRPRENDLETGIADRSFELVNEHEEILQYGLAPLLIARKKTTK